MQVKWQILSCQQLTDRLVSNGSGLLDYLFMVTATPNAVTERGCETCNMSLVIFVYPRKDKQETDTACTTKWMKSSSIAVRTTCISSVLYEDRGINGAKVDEEVSNWAETWTKVFMDETGLSESDLLIWRYLDVVSGIDLKDSPTEYLHNDEDILEWINRFEVTE